MEITFKLLGALAAIITIIVAINSVWKNLLNAPKSILFIDDNIDDFEVVNTLRNHGYKIETMKDVTDLDDKKIQQAKIIFVDYHGVGKDFGEEGGMSLIKALKQKYKKRKKIILFSARKYELTPGYNIADLTIRKNIKTSEFIEIIEKYK